jgi:hypothetical protein
LDNEPAPSYYTKLPKGLTAEELAAVQYHRDNLDRSTFLTQPNNDLTTFYGARMGTPEGVMYFPRYRNGVVLEPHTAFRAANRSGVKFPTYANEDLARAAETKLHGVMRADTAAFLAARAKAKK